MHADILSLLPVVSLVLFLVALFIFLVFLSLRYQKKTSSLEGSAIQKSTHLRQPLIDGKITEDPVENAKVFAELYDKNARRAKKKLHLAEMADLLATALVMIFAGETPALIIKILGGFSFVAKGTISIFKLREAWRSSRTAYQDLARIIETYLEGDMRAEDFAREYRRIKEAESDRFRQYSAEKGGSPAPAQSEHK